MEKYYLTEVIQNGNTPNVLFIDVNKVYKTSDLKMNVLQLGSHIGVLPTSDEFIIHEIIFGGDRKKLAQFGIFQRPTEDETF